MKNEATHTRGARHRTVISYIWNMKLFRRKGHSRRHGHLLRRLGPSR